MDDHGEVRELVEMSNRWEKDSGAGRDGDQARIADGVEDGQQGVGIVSDGDELYLCKSARRTCSFPRVVVANLRHSIYSLCN